MNNEPLRCWLVCVLQALLVWAVTLLLILCAVRAHGLEAQEVDFGLDGAYDGTVRITRDAEGRMLFSDAEVEAAVSLQALLAPPLLGSHGLLADLEADDHPQYLLHSELDAEAKLEALLGGLNVWSDADATLTASRLAATTVTTGMLAAGDVASSGTLLARGARWLTIPVVPYATSYDGTGELGWSPDFHGSLVISNVHEELSARLTIPLVFQPGTVLSRLRFRWSSLDASEGIAYYLHRRDDSSLTEAYPTTLAYGAFVGLGGVDVVELSPVTVAEGHAYWLSISLIYDDPDGQVVKLDSVAVETTTRAH